MSDNTSSNPVSDVSEASSQTVNSLAKPKKSLKRKFDEIDFSSQIIELHVHQLVSGNHLKKCFYVHENVFNLSLPNFADLYTRNSHGCPHYTITNITHEDFQTVIRWIVYGQIKSGGVDLTNVENIMDPLANYSKLFQLYQLTVKLGLLSLQNALINCIINTYATTNEMPWEWVRWVLFSSDVFYGFTGHEKLKKLVMDFIAYREHDEEASTWLKNQNKYTSRLPRKFYTYLACKMVDRKAVPPYMEDPSQYHVNEESKEGRSTTQSK